MPLNAGELDREVTFQQLAESTGATGFPVETWTTLVTVWCSKQDATGRERYMASQLSAPFDSTWRTYYRADLDPELVDIPKTRRLVYLGRIFNIVSARQIERKEGLEILTLATSKVA